MSQPCPLPSFIRTLLHLSLPFPPMSLMSNRMSVQFPTRDCLPTFLSSKEMLMAFLCSLTWSLRLCMFSLSRVSLCSLGPSPCHGLQSSLFWSGVPLLHHGGLPVRPGGLLSCLLHPGGLQSRLLCPGGPQSHLLHLGGLLSRLLSPGGIQSRLLSTGGLWFYLFHPGGLQSRLLCLGGLRSSLLCPGGLQSRLFHPGGIQSSLLHPGGLRSRLLRLGTLLCWLCLGSWSWHFLVDLALHPSPSSTSAPPPSWIALSLERLEAAPWGGALSRIRFMGFCPLAIRGCPSILLTLAPHRL